MDITRWGKTWPGTAFAALLLLLGCTSATPSNSPSGSAPAGSASGFPLTVTGDDGRSVSFEQPPARIVSLSPGHTETLYAIGAGDRMVGADEFSNYPPETSQLPKVGYSQVNLEQLVALHPDMVVAVTRQRAAVPEMEKLGLKVLYVSEAGTVEGILDRIRTFGEITARQEAAAALAGQMQKRIQAVTDKLGASEAGPTVFYELSPQYHTAGEGSFIGDILKKMKVQNIAAGIDAPFPQLSTETIIAADPEVILLADPEAGVTAASVNERPGWSGLRAVRNGRIITIPDRDVMHRPGPRVVEGIEFLAKALYPDKFP